LARPISDEELQLKKRARRRLVGAIVLVSVAAVVLPMVLDSEPKRSGQRVDIQIPSPDSGEFKPQPSTPGPSSAKAAPEAPAKAEASAKPDVSAKSEPAAKPDAPPKSEASGKPEAVAKSETPTPKKTEPASAAPERASSSTPGTVDSGESGAKVVAADRPKEAEIAKSAKSATSVKPANGSSNGAYVVQVAALSDAGKAKELEKRMASAGVKTYTELISTQSGEVTRVRAGPYATRDAAEKARAQLKKAGLEGKIVPK
jgi:DedD protein